MAFCPKCGFSVADDAAFCPHCGQPIGTPAGGPPIAAPVAGDGLRENVAAALSYCVGWITGIIFILIDKRPFVRFHAAQSIALFGALSLLRVVLRIAFFGTHGIGMVGFWALLSVLLTVITIVAWIACMILAYQGKRFEVPVAGPIAKNIASSPSI
jgi:uncharacterized membrane protein